MYQRLKPFMDPGEQKAVQQEGLAATLEYVSRLSPFYQKLFKTNNISVEKIRSVSDLKYLPTTDKEDIQKHNESFLCVPQTEVIEYAATSGTLGKPVYIALTLYDLDRLAYNEFLSFQLMKIGPEDVVQLMLTLDRQFMAGMAYYSGLKECGASIIRTGPGLPEWQIETANKLHTTAVVAVPSFLLKLKEQARELKINLNDLPVKKALCIGENIRTEQFEKNALAKQINAEWDLQLFSTYASTEMQTAFTECEHGNGGHMQPELIITEILDDAGNVLPEGEYGEVTITTIGVEGMPLVRYRTGDICCYYTSPCKCGRSTMRLSPVTGRKKQMIKYKGTTFYPPALFEMLNHLPHIKDYVVEVNNFEFGTDELILHVSSSFEAAECEAKLKPWLQSRLRIIPAINYLSAADIHAMQYPGNSRKPVKFLDKRK